MHVDWLAVAFGVALASLDSISLPFLKMAAKLGLGEGGLKYLIGAIGTGITQSILFFTAMRTTTMVEMNLMWDLLSDVSVTLIALFYFREKVTYLKLVGVCFSLVGMVLLAVSA